VRQNRAAPHPADSTNPAATFSILQGAALESQTITFATLPNQVYGTAPFTIGAAASSGLPVSFASTTPAVCTVSGATVTLASIGACTIEAAQAGNTTYAAATPVDQSFQVTPPASFSKCDINQDGPTNVVDVQRMIDEVLQAIPAVNDLDGDGEVTAADVQIVMRAALGLGCSAN
jgi:hypothetical protein